MVEFTCSGCNAKVMKHLSQLTRTDVVFCSLSCRNKNYKSVVTTWHPKNYIGFIVKLCEHCDISFSCTIAANGRKRRFCSKKCASNNCIRKPHSEVTKVKLSLIASKQGRLYKRNFIYNGPNGYHIMRSTWEVKYAQYLDSMGQRWQYEPTFILSNGKAYLPDFQLSTGDIIEVKGYMREDARVKWEMFCQEHPELNKSLVTKVEMKQLRLI